MASPARGMGRGLSAILAAAPSSSASEDGLREVPVELVAPNPRQPRSELDEAALVELAASVGARGVLQPVLVRPVPGGRYELVAGERRWRAARLAGLATVPAVVRAHTDLEQLEVAVIENMARADLSPVDEARACAALVEELGLSKEEVGRRVGRSRPAISNLIRLLDLPDETLDALHDGRLTAGHGRVLLQLEDHQARRRLTAECLAGGWSMRVLQERVDTVRATGAVAAVRELRHPDVEAALDRLREEFGRALGADVVARPAAGGGYRVTLGFGSLDEALAAVERARALAA